jgi:hypothetical protein
MEAKAMARQIQDFVLYIAGGLGVESFHMTSEMDPVSLVFVCVLVLWVTPRQESEERLGCDSADWRGGFEV